MSKFLKQILADNSGATAIEYGLLVSFLAIAAFGAIQAFAKENTKIWAFVKHEISMAVKQ